MKFVVVPFGVVGKSSDSVVTKMKRFFVSLLFIVSLNIHAEPSLKVIGLFKDKALVSIDGKNKLLRKGQPYQNFVLESANSKGAVISYQGASKKYQLGNNASGMQFKKARSSAFRITADPNGMYLTQGSINGKPMSFVVDTGATYVSMNQAHAKQLGIDAKRDGIPVKVMTASATVKAYNVKLKNVKIGEIQQSNVVATVMTGSHPEIILLGMSFLKHLKISHSGSVMTLEKL